MKRKTFKVRNSIEYEGWKKFGDFLDTKPEVPEIMRYVVLNGMLDPNPRSRQTLETFIRDRYPGFAMIERLK